MSMIQTPEIVLLTAMLGVCIACGDASDADGPTSTQSTTSSSETSGTSWGGSGNTVSGTTSSTSAATSSETSSASSSNTGGATSTTGAGAMGSGGASSGGASSTDSGGSAAGGSSSSTSTSTTGGFGPDNPAPCTESQPAGTNASGSGPHAVVVETNADPGIDQGTIFRPADLGGDELYPIFVWGQGACSRDGLANSSAMAEIASHGYFVVADGTPNGSGSRTMDRSDLAGMGAPLIAYVDWAVAENTKPCSAYYHSLDAAKIASNGFSCGGLMAQGTVVDPRIVTWGVTSSGMAGATQEFYDQIHTPVLFVEGGPAEVAYDGGLEGYQTIAESDVVVLWFSKDIGHGGDLFQPGGGDFTRINLAWLNWWLKGDEGPTGKGLLVGPECPYCMDPAWEVMSANVP